MRPAHQGTLPGAEDPWVVALMEGKGAIHNQEASKELGGVSAF